jgi:serine/threonine-protein kinase
MRYASAEEFIAALSAARERLPAGAATAIFATRPPSAPGTATRVAPAATALTTGVPPAALLLPPAEGEPPSDEDERAAKKRRSRRLALAGAAIAAIIALVLVLILTGPSSVERVTVPNVAGQSEASALTALRRAGLVPVPALTASSTVADGVVIGETPSAGSLVGKGTRVTIAVSTGPGSSPLPDVAGLTASQASAKLKEAGFKPVTEKQPSATVASGRVISTNPSAGTEAQAGSAVTVLVSSGPAQTIVPDVVGQSRAAAEATLTNAKLAAGAITQQSSTEQAPGTVLEQSPAAGASLPAGGTVSFVVAQAPTETPVPNVVGKNETQAAAELGRAGFTPQAVTQTTTDATQVGIVLRQSPAAGHKARKGATVTIAVGALGPQTTPTTTTPTTPATPTPPAASG